MARLTLYIGGREVDFGDESLILYTYRFEDLSNPASVRNSYSRPVTLPGTPRNDAVFGDFFRVSRRTAPGGGSGVSFNAMARTPFAIYDEGGELLESGYCKLDEVAVSASAVSYSVSLYGGLGDLLYAMMQSPEGDALTLSDLDYGPTSLDFYITRDAVREAWDVLSGGAGSERWQTLNFAPCYNGIPSDDFDADRALVRPGRVGLETSRSSGGKTYGTRNGYSLVTLKEKLSEWDTKDLRSYLQRPVLSVRALFDAIVRFASGLGYEMTLDPAFFNASNPLYSRTWLTLPLLSSIAGSSERRTDSVRLPAGGYTQGNDYGQIDLPAAPLGSSFDISVSLDPAAVISGLSADSYENAEAYLGFHTLDNNGLTCRALLVEVLVYDAGGQVIASSPVYSFQSQVPGAAYTTAQILALAGSAAFPVAGSGDTAETQVGRFLRDGSWSGSPVTASLSATDPVRIVVHSAVVTFVNTTGLEDAPWRVVASTQQPISNWGAIRYGNAVYSIAGTASYTYTTEAVMRSGALVRKTDLLGGSATPADYLLGYCRMMGLYLYYDKRAKRVDVLTRGGLYDNSVAVDIDSLIDRARPRALRPVVAESKFYDWTVASSGEYADYYANVYGRPYGLQRVNTGYGFNAERVDVVSGIPFRGAVEVLERRKYFVNIEEDGHPVPSPFVDGGKYTLYASDGSTLDLDVPTPTSDADITYFDDVFRTYDATPKVQLHASGGSPVENRDTLLFYRGPAYGTAYDRFTLTDDMAEMGALNGSTPCWLLEGYLSDEDEDAYRVGGDVVLPSFGRYRRDGDWRVVRSLDFGTPKEIDDPRTDVTGMEEAALYPALWRDYIADRYDIDTKAVTLTVDLSRLRPDISLLRRLFWFDGSLWVLSSINDADPLRPELTSCTFVQVRSMAAYLDGQRIPDGGEDDDPEPGTPGTRIRIRPESVVFPTAGGSISIRVITSGSWTLDVPAWVTASQVTGTGSTDVTLTAEANTGTQPKSGTITAAGSVAGTATASVTQPAESASYALELSEASHAFGAAGGSADLTVYGLTYVAGTLVSRVALAAGDLTITKGASDTYGQVSRSGLRFTAANLGANERAAMSVDWSISWNGVSATYTTTQAANAIESTSTTTVRAAVISYDAAWSVSGTDRASASGDSIGISISGTETPVTTRTWTSGATSQSSGTPQGWTPAGGWGPYITVSGTGFSVDTATMTASFAPNTGGLRSGYIDLTYEGTLLDVVSLQQAALATYTLMASVSSLAFPIPGDTYQVVITTNDPGGWVLSPASTVPDWLSVGPASGSSGQTTVSVYATRNQAGARFATLIFINASGTASATVEVSQAAALTLSVYPDTVAFNEDATPTGAPSFTVSANQLWEIDVPSGADWVTLNVNSGGSGDTVVGVTVSPHTGTSIREAVLTVRGVGDPTQAVTVTIRQDYPDTLYDIRATLSNGTALLPDGSNYATLRGVYHHDWIDTEVTDIAPGGQWFLLVADDQNHIRFNTAYGTTEVAAQEIDVNGTYAGVVSADTAPVPLAANTVESATAWVDALSLTPGSNVVPGVGGTVPVAFSSERQRTATWTSGQTSTQSEQITYTLTTTVGTLDVAAYGSAMLSVEQNPSEMMTRQIILTLSPTGRTPLTAVLNQSPYVSPYTIDATLSPDTFPALGDTAILSVAAGGGQGWQAVAVDLATGSAATWIEIENAQQSSSGTAVVRVDDNWTGSERRAEIQVYGSLGGYQAITIIQYA